MNFDFSQIMWFLFIVFTIWPMMKMRMLERSRYAMLQSFEKSRGSRRITMIHRQESVMIIGLPISRYINIEDSEQVLRAIRMTPDDMPIDIVLHTPGGLVLAERAVCLSAGRGIRAYCHCGKPNQG